MTAAFATLIVLVIALFLGYILGVVVGTSEEQRKVLEYTEEKPMSLSEELVKELYPLKARPWRNARPYVMRHEKGGRHDRI